MSDACVATVLKMIETLPEAAQERVTDHLREYIEDLRDEIEWEAKIAESPEILVRAAERADREIAAGLSEPMDFDRL